MLTHIHTEADLDLALTALGRRGPRFWRTSSIWRGGRRCAAGPMASPGLVAVVVAQQLSTASANAIWGRLAAAFDPLFRRRPSFARAGHAIGAGRIVCAQIRALKEIARAIVRE